MNELENIHFCLTPVIAAWGSYSFGFECVGVSHLTTFLFTDKCYFCNYKYFAFTVKNLQEF